MDNRKLYDLCRRYKYFYKKHQDVKDWSHKYHDLDFSSMLDKTRVDVKLCQEELMMTLFDVFQLHCISMEVECPVDRFLPSNVSGQIANVEIRDSVDFIRVLSHYLDRGFTYEM